MNSDDAPRIDADLPQPPTPSWYGQLITMASRSLDDMKNEPGKIHSLVAVKSDYYNDHSDQDLLKIFWDDLNPTFPPIDFKFVDWLVQASEKAGDSGRLATYALNPTWAGFPKGRWLDTEGRVLHEALRIIVRAAARRPPQNHSDLWMFKDSEVVAEWPQNRLLTLKLLTASWSGVPEERCFEALDPQHDANLFPAGDGWALFERLLRDYPLGDFDGCANLQPLTLQAAFVAWKEGNWTPQTFRSLLDAPLFDSTTITGLKPSKFQIPDSSFKEFGEACPEITRKTLDLLLADDELELAAKKFRDVEPSLPAIDLILKVGLTIEANGESHDLTVLIRPLRVPSGDNKDSVKKLKQLAPKTLLALTQETSEWLPLILEAIPDRKLAVVLKTVIGTFRDDLVPPEITGFCSAITYSTLHPGKAACGFTNLQPFFEMLAVTPLSVIKKAIPVLRRSDHYNQSGISYVTHFAGLPPGRHRSYGVLYKDVWFIELSRRIRLESADREFLISQRVESISLYLFENCARKTVASAPRSWVVSAIMCAHAESAGFPSTKAALLDAAQRWAATPELVRDGLTLLKCSNTPEGIILMKGKRTVQNLPPALKKDPEITHFRAEAFSLWQTRLLFEAEVMTHFFKTGEFLDHSGFYDVFGCQATDTLRCRLAASVPEEFEKEFLAVIESKSIKKHHFTCIPPFNPAHVLPELIRRGWEHWLGNGDYKGFYFTAGEDNMIFSLFEIVSVDPDAYYREGTTPPSTPHTLAMVLKNCKSDSSIDSSAPPKYSPAYHQRVNEIVLRDLVAALLPMTS